MTSREISFKIVLQINRYTYINIINTYTNNFNKCKQSNYKGIISDLLLSVFIPLTDYCLLFIK